MTEAKRELKLTRPDRSWPLVDVGTEVKIDRYMGVLDAEDERPAYCVIIDIRLKSNHREEWEGSDDGFNVDEVTYPNGWEYYVVRKAALDDAWGWVAEDVLVKAGYRVCVVCGKPARTADPHPECVPF